MSQRARLLCVGLSQPVRDQLLKHMRDPELEMIADMQSWDALFSAEKLDFHAVICGPNPFGMQATEVAQSAGSFLPNIPVYFITENSKDLLVQDLLKNGFQQTFLLPADEGLLAETLSLLERQATGSSKTVHRAVSLIDVEAGEPLDFEVSIYLRINKKYVRIINEGKSLDKAKIEKFKSYQVDRVYIDAAKLDRFYKYSANKLRKLNQAQSGVSETERLDKMQKSLRKILHAIFDSSGDATFEQGRQIFEDTSKIITEMIGTSAAVNLSAELSKTLGQSPEASNRSGRVSTLAALFEMAMGLKQTQQAAIAGLFMDIGLSQLPAELQDKPYAAMTDDEKKEYGTHPTRSLQLLQARRMAVPPEVQAAIQNHHEKFDGNGFPAKVPGHKLSALSQVVAAADRFERLVFDPVKPVAAALAIEVLRTERICSPEVLAAIGTLVRAETKAA